MLKVYRKGILGVMEGTKGALHAGILLVGLALGLTGVSSYYKLFPTASVERSPGPHMEIAGFIREYDPRDNTIVLDIKSPYGAHERAPLRIRIAETANVQKYAVVPRPSGSPALLYFAEAPLAPQELRGGEAAFVILERSPGTFVARSVAIFE